MKKAFLLCFIFILLCVFCFLSIGCSNSDAFSVKETGDAWYAGFGSAEIPIPEDSDDALYIAGYNNGKEISGVLDLQRANALWLDTGEDGVLLIGVDCVGLGRDTVKRIREKLSDFCKEYGCAWVNIYATHTHAGVDTLGLWGPVAIDGKNNDFIDNLTDACLQASIQAYENRSEGTLRHGRIKTEGILEDSRAPYEYDSTLYQVRFEPKDTDKSGIRLLSYPAHAESLRGKNTLVSRDFPGVVYDIIKEEHGDDTMYLPSAVGGLIMTREFTDGAFNAKNNMELTARAIADAACSITDEETLSPALSLVSKEVDIPLDNTLFMYYRFLGILGNPVCEGESDTGYMIKTEIGVLSMGELSILLAPGEIFPELVSGTGLSEDDPVPLLKTAQKHGVQKLLILGLCNDEIGYILPPSDFLLHDTLPYIESAKDKYGESHYEETNSLGKDTAHYISRAFDELLSIACQTK